MRNYNLAVSDMKMILYFVAGAVCLRFAFVFVLFHFAARLASQRLVVAESLARVFIDDAIWFDKLLGPDHQLNYTDQENRSRANN